jgi:hypothetical protein
MVETGRRGGSRLLKYLLRRQTLTSPSLLLMSFQREAYQRSLHTNEKAMIVFRLLYTKAEARTSSTRFNEDGDLPARGLLPTHSQTFDHRLSWYDRNFSGPFLSTFCSWRRIMNWRRWMLRQGGVNIGDLYVVAIDTDRVNTCNDAYGMAQRLGYTDSGIHPRRRLSNYRDEYLIYGGISAD